MSIRTQIFKIFYQTLNAQRNTLVSGLVPYAMPRKSHSQHPLNALRRTLGLSQTALARLIGVTPCAVKRIENGRLKISRDFVARLFLATGSVILETPGGLRTITWTGERYTRQSFELWKAELQPNSAVASALSAQLVRWIEILMLASARPGAGKTVQVFHAVLQSLQSISEQFKMHNHIDALLRERHSTETQLYRVADLRENSALATRVQFHDDPKWKDDDQILLTKPTGWLQHLEIFDLLWTHRDVLTSSVSGNDSGSDSSLDLLKTLAEVEKQLEAIL